jgi:hypothetical protein
MPPIDQLSHTPEHDFTLWLSIFWSSIQNIFDQSFDPSQEFVKKAHYSELWGISTTESSDSGSSEGNSTSGLSSGCGGF